VLTIDEFDTSTTPETRVRRHEVPTRLIRERVLDTASLETTGRSLRIATFGLDGDVYPFLPQLAYEVTSTSDRIRTTPQFNVILESRPEDGVPVASFSVDPVAYSEFSATDLYGPGEFLRFGNIGSNIFNPATPNQGLVFLNENWADGITAVARDGLPVVDRDTEFRLVSIEVRGYEYRSDRLLGLSERVRRLAPNDDWATGRPSRAYSVLYRLNADGSTQVATFVYRMTTATQNSIVGDEDTVDFVPVDFTPTATEIEGGLADVRVGRAHSPVVKVEFILGTTKGGVRTS